MRPSMVVLLALTLGPVGSAAGGMVSDSRDPWAGAWCPPSATADGAVCGLARSPPEPAGDPMPRAVFEVGPEPVAVAVDPVLNMVYVAHRSPPRLSVLRFTAEPVGVVQDPELLRIFELSSRPKAIAVDPSLHRVYVALGNEVLVVEGLTGQPLASLAVDNPMDVAVDTTTHDVFVVSHPFALFIFDGLTYDRKPHVPTCPAHRVAVDGTSGRLFVGCFWSVVLAFHREEEGWIRTGLVALPEVPGRLHVAEGSGMLYASLPGQGRVVALRQDTLQLAATSEAIESPQGVAVAGDSAYAVASHGARLVALDAETLALQGQAAMPDQPWAVAVDPNRARVYATAFGPPGVLVALDAGALLDEGDGREA